MFSLHFRIHPTHLGLGIAVSSLLAFHSISRQRLVSPTLLSSHIHRCDASPSSSFNAEINKYQRNAQAPIVSGGRFNPKAIRQISMGSIAGLLCGLAVSVFSKPLAVILGLLVCGVQALESRGLHIVPYSKLQSFFTNTDLRSAMQDNVAFKISFGMTFALSAFAEF